jgi:hypothetical protein
VGGLAERRGLDRRAGGALGTGELGAAQRDAGGGDRL